MVMATAKKKAAKRAPQKPPLADEKVGYLDVQSTTSARTKPLILRDGTSVEWPKNFTRRDMQQWRKHRNLLWSQRHKRKNATASLRT